MGEIFDFPKPTFEDMESLLKFLFKASEKESLIFVLDEYHYLRENEVSMYLNSEISKITNANEVFEALARGF